MKKLLLFFIVIIVICFLIYIFGNIISLQSKTYFIEYNINKKYNINTDDIKKVDFNNFKYNLKNEIYFLENGKYEKRYQPFGFSNVCIEFIYYYVSLNNTYAIIHLKHHYGGGSSSIDNSIQLFYLKDKFLYCTDSISYSNPIKIDYIENREIKIKSKFYFEDDAKCCPSGIEEDIFKIETNNFKLLNSKVHKE
jgi:hypothetical protein